MNPKEQKEALNRLELLKTTKYQVWTKLGRSTNKRDDMAREQAQFYIEGMRELVRLQGYEFETSTEGFPVTATTHRVKEIQLVIRVEFHQ